MKIISYCTITVIIIAGAVVFSAYAEASSEIYITEIMHNSSVSGEWLEIVNAGDSAIDLTNLALIVDGGDSISIQTDGNTSLAPRSVAVIAANPEAFRNTYGNDILIYTGTFTLPDTDMPSIALYSGTEMLLYEIKYTPQINTNNTDLSLHLSSSGASIAAPATPGEVASNSIIKYSPVEDIVSVSTTIEGITDENILRVGSTITLYIFGTKKLEYVTGSIQILESDRPIEFTRNNETSFEGTYVIQNDEEGEVSYSVKLNGTQDKKGMVKHNGEEVSIEFAPSLRITELQYAPQTGKTEWIEIKNIGSTEIDISVFIITDIDGSKEKEREREREITNTQGNQLLEPGEFAIIAVDETKFKAQHESYTGLLFQSTPGLRDTGDTIRIRKNNEQKTLIHSVTYSEDDGANKNGKTLHVTEDGDIFESYPTPGSITPPPSHPQEEEPVEDDEEEQVEDDEDEENLEHVRSSNIPKVQIERFNGVEVIPGRNLFFTSEDKVVVTLKISDDETRYDTKNIRKDYNLTEEIITIKGASIEHEVEIEDGPDGTVTAQYTIRFLRNYDEEVEDSKVTLFVSAEDENGNRSRTHRGVIIVRNTQQPIVENSTNASTLGFYEKDAGNIIVPIEISLLKPGDWLQLRYTGTCGDGLLKFVARNGGHGIPFNLSKSTTYDDCKVTVTDSARNVSNPPTQLPTIVIE